jgi:hypothetical protein
MIPRKSNWSSLSTNDRSSIANCEIYSDDFRILEDLLWRRKVTAQTWRDRISFLLIWDLCNVGPECNFFELSGSSFRDIALQFSKTFASDFSSLHNRFVIFDSTLSAWYRVCHARERVMIWSCDIYLRFGFCLSWFTYDESLWMLQQWTCVRKVIRHVITQNRSGKVFQNNYHERHINSLISAWTPFTIDVSLVRDCFFQSEQFAAFAALQRDRTLILVKLLLITDTSRIPPMFHESTMCRYCSDVASQARVRLDIRKSLSL